MENFVGERRYLGIYFLVYLAVVGVLLGVHWGDLSKADPLDRIVAVAAIFGVSAGAAVVAAILAEFGGWLIMLLIPDAVKKLMREVREEGRAEGLAEGRAENNAEWEAWLARRDEALTGGREFDEPPPSARNGRGGSR